ncbi:PD-(D/E)XK nuclease family protein [Allorhodopirellula solitaria]|uniref:PD-(D/E)XK nuclease family protein n=1 Tax=Allorhodopirellula solitaria TaxID=2527987 RepID=UPI0011B70F37|nr:PD-(D/E)XK nuclease family protein [Allorhodopirellula solitaria]
MESTSGKRETPGSRSVATRCERVFCGWDEPLLQHAARWLIEQRGTGSSAALDLSGWDVVLPSSRAITRLREKLAEAARANRCEYRSPRFYLVGQLPGLLYRRPAEWATDFEQSLAWARVLSATDTESLKTLVPTPPEPDATAPWLDLASTLRRLWTKVAAENMTFAEVQAKTEAGAEQRRWEVLGAAFDLYRRELQSAERCDPYAAALDKVASGQCRASRPIVLVGASDLSEMVKAMLGQVAAPVTALVAAPQSDADRFDATGCLIPERWKEHRLPLGDEQLVPATGVDDQSRAVIEALADFGQEHSVDAITIGVTDPSQIEPIENHCRLMKVPTYRHMGWTVAETSVGRLLDLLVTYRQRRTWRALAALVRHAAVYQLIDRSWNSSQPKTASPKRSKGWLTSLDQLLSEAFPRGIDHPLPATRQETAAANQVRDCLQEWLAPLDRSARPIRKWSQVLLEVLESVYADTIETEAIDDPTSLAVTATRRVLLELENLSESLDAPIESLAALELLTNRIADIPLSDSATAEKIEILGWLDLALDDAPALVVCGLNHPYVPEAAASDPYLPSSLQSALSQRVNDRRYARDVHAMHQMLTSRSEVRFLVGTHSADGSPTPPSRLLAAASPDDAARRVCGILTEHRPAMSVVSQDACMEDQVADQSHIDYFRPPPSQPGRTVETLSVTAFSAYLACPYRFYLRYVLGLRPLDDSTLELAANQFGDLVHGALEYFGESKAKDEPDPDKIAAELTAQLHRYASEYYGDNTASTVQIQVRQAERRLKTVALRQAERIAQGWRIHAVEASVDELDFDRKTKKPKQPTGILIDGKFTGLRGRFDRIDYHPELDRWAILDYKTHGHLPEKKHLKKLPDGSVQWVDLQLPLYRRFIPDLGIPADPIDVELGYFNVAEKDAETKINLATFTQSQFDQADELIHDCVRKIRDCQFESHPAGVQYDDYEMMFNESINTVPVDDECETSEVSR